MDPDVGRVVAVVEALDLPARVRGLGGDPAAVQAFATAYHPVPDTVAIFVDRAFGHGPGRRVETAVAAVALAEVAAATARGLEALVGRRVARALADFRPDPAAGCGDYRDRVLESLLR